MSPLWRYIKQICNLNCLKQYLLIFDNNPMKYYEITIQDFVVYLQNTSEWFQLPYIIIAKYICSQIKSQALINLAYFTYLLKVHYLLTLSTSLLPIFFNLLSLFT